MKNVIQIIEQEVRAEVYRERCKSGLYLLVLCGIAIGLSFVSYLALGRIAGYTIIELISIF